MRRSLGYRLSGQGRLLLDFADQMDRAGQTRLTIIAALAWATQAPGTLPVTRRLRLSVVRCFARHLQTLDPSCEVPPAGLLAAAARRPAPSLYSPQEIPALIHAAETLARPLAAATCQALISLLAVTGLRIGEALSLGRADVDLDHGVLHVTGKYGKVRLVPLHATTVAMLTSYASVRDRLCPVPQGTSFFITCTGRPVPAALARRTFWKLLDRVGIRTPPGRRRPRIHDLRHFLRRQHLPALVPGRSRRSGERACPVHLPGAPVPGRHLLVLLRFPGYSDTRSFLRVTGPGPGLTCSCDSRLSE
jgi:integrase/recombinase XerD